MANRKATMTDLRLIIREFSKGTPLREIERRFGISRTSLRPYKERAEASGKSFGELLLLEDADLHAILVRNDAHRGRDEERYQFMQANVESYAQQMQSRHMTYDVLYEDYCKTTSNPYGYTQFKAIIQKYEKDHDYKYHNVYAPGHEMQFDFAGDPLWIVDPATGEGHKMTVLVAVLPYSMLSFVIAMPSAKMEYFFTALSKAVTYFGGATDVSKTDNMTQWVKKYDRYEPALNEAARQWCLHYGTNLDNCRSRKPRDKGPAESLVNQAYRYHYSRIHDETFTTIESLNARLMELNDQFNDEIMKGRTFSRRQKYESEERCCMLPLPPEPYRFKYEKSIKINNTYHFQIGKNQFYSVPYQYVGQKAKVVYDSETVEVWVDMKRITVHKRAFKDGYTTVREHMPERHRAYAETQDYNAAYFQKKARQVGPETLEVINVILSSAVFVQQSYRSCQGVLRLANHYGADRLEAACGMINPKSAATYKVVKSILANNKDKYPADVPSNEAYIPFNENVRGAESYK